MAAKNFIINCEQGADLILAVTFAHADGSPVNLTGGIARMMARVSLNATTPFLSIDSNMLGGISLAGSSGVINILVPAAATTAFPAIKTAVYDLVFTDSAGSVSRVIEGRFIIDPQVTR